MAASAPLVSETQLDALERLLVDQEAAVVPYFRTGLTEGEMDELSARFNLVLSSETRRWYGWHDGVEGAGTELQRSIGGWRPMPLRSALAFIDEIRQIHAEVLERLPPDHRYDLDWKWSALWLPFARPGHGAALGLDCGVPAHCASPVFYVEWADPVEGPPHPDAPSLGTLIDRWTGALEDGRWLFDTALQHWRIRA
jgi:hypothetical protein